MRTAPHRLVASVVVLASLVGCKEKEEPITPAPEVSEEVTLRRLTGCDDLRARVNASITEAIVGGGGFRGFPGGVEDDLAGAPEADGGGDAAGGGQDGPTSWTGTNNQEEGVEELDLVQTDGERLYVAQDRWLQIVDSFPAETSSLLATVELDGWARGLFQADASTLVVVEDLGGISGDDGSWSPLVRARVVDVTNPAAPVTTRTVDLEGWLVDARMIDAQVYLVLTQPMDVPYDVWEQSWQALSTFTWPAYDADEAAWTAARARARAIVAPIVEARTAAMADADLLPGARSGDGAFAPMYDCTDLYEPEQVSQLAMLGVAKINPAAGLEGAAGVLSDGWTVYASTTSLYIGQTSWWWWGWDTEPRSHIHKFDLSGAEPVYAASGAVDGWMYDQFAMSEYDGHLRVVTTQFGAMGGGVAVDVEVAEGGDAAEGGGSTEGSEGSEGGSDPAEPPDAGEVVPPEDEPSEPAEDDPATEPPDVIEPPVDPNAPANDVWVLRDDGAGTLAEIGHLGGIAPGETVQSVRLMGEKGYVVTFRQTDPLFVIDLSNPSAPAMVGELVMPGFSAYLHPIDADHLLGVGMIGLQDGTLTGVGIHLFDVSDPSSPQLIQSHPIDPGANSWSWSEAMWDHHAFTWRDGVLTIPAFSSSWDEETGVWSGFSGAITFSVDPTDGIVELGRVNHASLVDGSLCLPDLLWGGMDGDVAVEEPKPEEDRDDAGGDQAPPDGGGASEPDPGGEPWSYCTDGSYWYAEVRRTRYIDDYLYSVSNYGVLVSELYDPSIEVASVRFHPAE